MTPVLKLSRFFLLASIATTFIKIPSFQEYYRVGDLLLLISFIFMLIAVMKRQISLLQDKKLVQIVLFWIGVNILGSLISYFIYKELPSQRAILNYARLGSCLIIFTEIILLSTLDKLIVRKSILCLMYSLIIIPLAYIFHYIGAIEYLMWDPSRFSGLLIDPNYFASFQLIPTILLLFFLMKGTAKRTNQILLYIGFVCSVSMILWSGSRSGILGLLTSLVILVGCFILFSQTPKWKIAFLVCAVIISIPLAFLFVPKHIQVFKNSPSVEPPTPDVSSRGPIFSLPSITKIPQETRVESFVTVSGVTAGKGRLEIWKNSIPFILKNPFGYGPGYNYVINIQGEGYEHRVVHNFELELLLQGGIFLFVFCNYFLIKLVVTTYKSLLFKKYNEVHALIAILLGLLASALFLDSIPQKWIWIIVALIVVYIREHGKDHTATIFA